MGIFFGLLMFFTIVVAFVIYAIALIFSPKMRAKLAAREIKTQKYILEQNEDLMREVATRDAEIKSPSLETSARALKKGFTNEDSIFCKHCGAIIDKDSFFCKVCGKEQ